MTHRPHAESRRTSQIEPSLPSRTTMTLQNRADPWGRLHAVSARGTLLGNRGKLHDEHRRVVRHWARNAWVACDLEFNGRKREVFGPSTYSELFFLDEATAFAAGHRPCATCRRLRYDEFKSMWVAGNAAHLPARGQPMSEIDKLLHTERVDNGGQKLTHAATLGDLPLGSFIEAKNTALLVWHKGLLEWSFEGYKAASVKVEPSTRVSVLTPISIVRTFAAGYRPTVHPSAIGAV